MSSEAGKYWATCLRLRSITHSSIMTEEVNRNVMRTSLQDEDVASAVKTKYN